MGLFGGFKAKFTKDSTAKSANKSSKKNEVVCVGYRVYSEFQDPPQYLPQPEHAIRKRPSAIKTVLQRPESSKNSNEINAAGPSTAPVETRIITNPIAKKAPKNKAPKISNKIAPTVSSNVTNQEFPRLKTTTSSKSLAETNQIELKRDKQKDNSRSSSNLIYIEGKTSSFNPALNVSNTSTNGFGRQDKEPPKSILKSKSLSELGAASDHISDTNDNYIVVTNNIHDSASEDEQYDKIITTASKKPNESNGYKSESVNYLSATKSVSRNHTTEVSTYVHTGVEVNNIGAKTVETSSSNSVYSSGFSYSQNTRAIGSTSSYAANIFFGGDEEPEVQRPRRVNLSSAKEEQEGRSSAEC